MKNKRWIASIVEVVLGLVLTVCGVLGIVDTYWSGMGGGLLGVGLIQLARYIRYYNNETYKSKVDVEVNDERNKFIALRAWAWAGFWYVMFGAVGSIVLQMLGKPELATMAGGSVCLLMVLHWGCRIYLRRKY